MFRMQCEGTRKDGGQCESMVNYNGWNLDDAGGIYCRHHINQGYFRPTSNEQQPEPVKLSDIVKYTPHFFGLIIFFKQFPILQEIIKIIGSGFISYFSYKIASNKISEEQKINNPIKFINMLFFQFINPKAVLFAIMVITTFINTNENFLRDTIIVLSVAITFSFVSIFSWCLLGKFLRRFATNKKFVQTFNYVMSFLLIVCVIMFYV